MSLLARRGAVASVIPDAGGYESEVLTDSPLGLWMLNEASGADMLDSSGNSRDGTYSAVTLAQTSIIPTVTDTCADFNGTTSYATVAAAAWMKPTRITVEAVVVIDAIAGGDAIAGRYGGSNSKRSWALYVTGGSVYFFGRNGTTYMQTGAGAIALSTPTHVAGSYDGSKMRVYVNGSLEAESATAVGDLLAGSEPLRIGQYGTDLSSRFNGRIQGCAMHDSALSPARILAHAEAAGLA